MPDNPERHRATIDDLYRQTKAELWTPSLATLVLLLFGLLIATVFFNVAVFSFGHWIVALIVYLTEAIVPLVVLYRHQRQVKARVREKVREMDAAHPGLYDAYRQSRP